MGNKVRVATWNIGSLYDQHERNLQYVENLLTAQKIDILCMQELPKEAALLDQICAWGGFSCRVYHTTSVSHVGQGHDMGISVFSRFPLGQPDILKLTKPTVEIFYKGRQEYWHDKCFMAVPCDLPGQKMLVVTGHGFPFHRYDLENPENYHIIRPSFREMDAWFGALPEKQGMPVLCAAADFNMTDPMPFLEVSGKPYRDLFHGQVTRPFGRKTDGLLISQNVRVTELVNITPPEEQGAQIMDHHFILAELEF